MNINKKIQQEIIEASKLLDDRGEVYGNAIQNHSDIKDFFNLVLGNKLNEQVTEIDVILCIIGQKLARLVKSPDHEDSFKDIINYCGIALIVNQNKEKQYDIASKISFTGEYDGNDKET
tara:strand:+ start:336 stop:692 length:357 start_codon:yes stop_codon:yes gene_type:complete